MTLDARERLVEAARGARDSAYAPYSGFKVGAAVLCADGAIAAGANVENASYGLTICAERSAVFAGVSAGHIRARGDVLAVAIAGPGAKPTPPCGACRQVICEFAHPDAEVLMCGEEGSIEVYAIADLLPFTFSMNDNDG